MKHTLFAHICLLSVIGISLDVTALSDRSYAIATAASMTKLEPTDTIAVPKDTETIIKKMLFGVNNPKIEAEKLLHNIFIALKDNQNLSGGAKQKLNHIKAILKRCIDEDSSMIDWLNLKNINFKGIISDELLEDIEKRFSGIAFMMRLKSA